jgi:hypothetical protein
MQYGPPHLIQLSRFHLDRIVEAANNRSPEIRVLAIVNDGRDASHGNLVQQYSPG